MTNNAKQPAGMEKSELKLHVRLARRAPVHIAFALGGDGKAVIMMDKRKPPRAILKDLKQQATDARNHRFGVMTLDEDNPKLARITVDKAASGLARKLIKAFQGTGLRQIELVTEDGESVDSAMSEADENDDDEGAAETGSSKAAPTAGDKSQTAADPAGPDAASLATELTGLVKRMMDAIAADPSSKSGLTELAIDARASIKGGDLRQAEAAVALLRDALDGAAQPDAQSEAKASPETAKAPAPVGPQAVARYRKSRQVWLATRAKVDADIKKLSQTILSIDHDGAFGDDLEQNFLSAIDPVLSTLDDSLADILAGAEQASSDDEAAGYLDQARTTVGLYQQFVQSDDTIRELDRNPFVPLAIAKTLNASLAALSAAMH